MSPAATTTGGPPDVAEGSEDAGWPELPCASVWSLTLLPPSVEALAHATGARDTRHTKPSKRIVFVRTARTSL
jgi:hypothetical protein